MRFDINEVKVSGKVLDVHEVELKDNKGSLVNVILGIQGPKFFDTYKFDFFGKTGEGISSEIKKGDSVLIIGRLAPKKNLDQVIGISLIGRSIFKQIITDEGV